MRRLRRRLVAILVFYFLAGTASQKLVPGVDEIFPFFGWSLFSRVPQEASAYDLLVLSHDGRRLDPPPSLAGAPVTIVGGDRYIARKLIQELGRAFDRGDRAEAERLRRLLERNYLRGRVDYELVFARFDPLEKWRTGADLERRSVARLEARPGARRSGRRGG